MYRRSRGSFLLLGLLLIRYNRVGRMLRLGQSICLGFPTSFKLGNGAGRWWSALALFLAFHGTI
eukprot:9495236-Pyramimonas_sp.AAC.1